MATLTPKEITLRLLNPQPSDGTGPGYISANDVKITCGNLWDLIDLVNRDMDLYPSLEDLKAIQADVQSLNNTMHLLMDALVDDNNVLRPFSTVPELQSAIVGALNLGLHPDKEIIDPGEAFTDPSTNSAADMNRRYASSWPVNWGTSTKASTITWLTTCTGASGDHHFWWDGTLFREVLSTPPDVTGVMQGDPSSVVPGDRFVTRDVSKLSDTIILVYGMRGGPLWVPGTGQSFTISSPGMTKEFHWVDDPVSPNGGHFLGGPN